MKMSWNYQVSIAPQDMRKGVFATLAHCASCGSSQVGSQTR